MLKYSAHFKDGNNLIVFQPLDSDCFTTWDYLESKGYQPVAIIALQSDLGSSLSLFCG